MTRQERERLEVLTLAMLDGELGESDARELDALLADDDAARLHGVLLEQEAVLRGERRELDVVARTVAEIESGERVERNVLTQIARRSWTRGQRWLAAAALLLVVSFGGSAAWVASWSAAPQEALVFAAKVIEPGSPLNLRVLVRHARSLHPYANTAVHFALIAADGTEAWSRQITTDDGGVASVGEPAPADLAEGAYTLRIVAHTEGQTPAVSRAVDVRRLYRIYVTTDKPRYQPGQTMHLRALAMTSSGLVPVNGGELTFRARDAKGNLVLERTLKTSKFGLAYADFELAEQVNTGSYAVSATIGTTASERAVIVEHYVLPKLKVEVNTDAPHYAPGANITGTVQASYVFGEPVEDARVAVKMVHAQSDVDMGEAAVTPGEPGKWQFTMGLPERFGALESTELAIVASVTDRAGFSNEARVQRMVTRDPFLVDVAVAGGHPVRGVPNQFYLSFRTPDGAPSRAAGTFGGQRFEADETGIAVVSLPPTDAPTVVLEAGDLRRDVPVHAVQGVVLHSDRSVYDGAASIRLTVFASTPEGTAFVDAVQGGSTLFTQAIPLRAGGAELTFDVPADVHGPVRLRAFHADARGELMRSDRVVLVRARSGLELSTTLDRDVYRPGETAKLRVAVTKGGVPTPAALSIAGVDEAVFAMGETRPGLEKAFFEMLASDAVRGPGDDRATGAALSAVQAPDDAVALQGPDSYRARVEELERRRTHRLHQIAGVALLIPLFLSILLMFGLMWRLGRTAWRAPSQNDPDLVSDVRNVLFAWFAALLVPLVGGVLGGNLAYEIGALFMAIVSVIIMIITLRILIARVSGQLSLGLLVPAYGTAVLGVFALIAGARFVSDDLIGVGLFTAYVCWGLVGGVVAAAGHRVATGVSHRRVVWLVASRSMATLVPGLLLLGTFVLGARKSAEMPAMVAGVAPVITESAPPPHVADAGGQAAPARVRSYFPETLLWQPEVITDERGEVALDVQLADSITTWRLSLSAVSAAGDLGASEKGLRVFQPFFIEPNLPLALTQDDMVSVPVAVFNYLDVEQTVDVALADADWLQIEGPVTRSVVLAPREVKRVAFVVTALRAGEHRFTVSASANALQDGVERVVVVTPNGQRVDHVQSGELTTVAPLSVSIPHDAIAGSEDLVLKLYPGAFSQVAEGMEGVFRMPSGCFEQTSSVTYPSLLVLDYMRTQKLLRPELAAKAERFVQLGYQRLLSFEVPGGGFEWFGKTPAHPVLTAYGLMELTDMQRVQSVDAAVIQRTQMWLLGQQRADGTWTMGTAGIHEGATNAHAGNDVRTTAYIAWALIESGAVDPRLTRALDGLASAASSETDSYTLALIGNALVAGKHPGAAAALTRLAGQHQSEAGLGWWTSKAQGVTYGGGDTLNVEATALAARALLRANQDVAVAHRALAWLMRQRDPNGTWRSTQATVAAMRALLAAAGTTHITKPLEIAVVVDGEAVKTIAITPETADVFHLVSLRAPVRKGARAIELRSTGGGAIAYQLVTTYYQPWAANAGAEDLSVELRYSKTELSVHDDVTASVVLSNRRNEPLQMAMLEVEVPPGFAIDTLSLDALTANTTIARHERRGAKLLFYLRHVPIGGQLALSYRLVAEQPADVKAQPATAYLYYEPHVRATSQPVALEVR